MSRRAKPLGKTRTWQDLPWKKNLLIPTTHVPGWLRRWRINRSKARKAAEELFPEDAAACGIRIPFGKGKVTDAGYDAFACVSTTVAANRDFDFEADVTVRRFLGEPGPNNQEAFGLFVRSTLAREYHTGIYYANMVAVGGYYGRYNFFGRSGIDGRRIDRVCNFTLYHPANRPGGVFQDAPLRYAVADAAPQSFHLSLSRRGGHFYASMTDAQGLDVLSPSRNGGTGELSGSGVERDDRMGYGVRLPDAMGRGTRGRVHLGMFAAGGSWIVVDKGSVRLTILGRSARQAAADRARPPDEGLEAIPEPLPDVRAGVVPPTRLWIAAPGGAADAAGTREDPMDIHAAVERCGCGEGILLRPGTYRLDRPLAIGRDRSGTAQGRKLLTGDPADGGVLLDLCGHALSLRGDYWILEHLRVTNGYGIQIEGSFNWLRSCVAFRNRETGILIRHHDNASPGKLWPRGNRIEGCVAYENRDPAECNADGFACKVAAGPGNVFSGCVSFLNCDDGFDLYAKNRPIGTVRIERCRSCLNGYRREPDGTLAPTGGNGNGFKLGGSGMYLEHRAEDCVATGNKRDGFTSNSNPYLHLERCVARNNGRKNIGYGYFEGSHARRRCEILDCAEGSDEAFDPRRLAEELLDEAP